MITGPSRVVTQHPVDLLVAPTDARWPNYPTGALSPDDTTGGELYGRTALIRKLLSTFGPTRSQATYLVEAPRQMGKTSLLNFVRKQVPDHVFAVYVNLELPWSRSEPDNVWNYLVDRILVESGQGAKASMGCEPQTLVNAAAVACETLQKKYVVLLLDDFHSLLERAQDPRSVLAVLRDFHNNSLNRISLLIADRYTREELEARCPNEYWAQLTILPLGPLDRAGTQSAITAPAQDSDVAYLAETIERLYYWTAGYPYHLQRAVQYMLDAMWSGPWLTAISSDVDAVVPRIVAEDNLFQAGLCRPDRIDSTAEQAIAALLEWGDLVTFLPTISADPEWAEILTSWQPRPVDLLADIGDAPALLRHLAAIGVVRETNGQYELFSPLLVSWLREMRRQGRSLKGGGKGSSWGVPLGDDAANLTGADWQRLDSELIQRCRGAKAKPPLRERATSPDDWNNLAREVCNHLEFKQFLGILFGLFIDGREERESMLTYPWLTLAYHRCRLVRNYFQHSGATPTRSAVLAWDQVCSRALGKECHSCTPATSEEWRTIQVSMLRVLYSGLRNAIALVGSRHLASAPEPVS